MKLDVREQMQAMEGGSWEGHVRTAPLRYHWATLHSMDPVALKLYLVLWDLADDDGKVEGHSRRQLADMMGFTQATSMDRALKILEDEDYVAVHRRLNPFGGHAVNIYRLRALI